MMKEARHKGGVGRFEVWHLGPNLYRVIDKQTGAVCKEARSISEAYRHAGNLNEQHKRGDYAEF